MFFGRVHHVAIICSNYERSRHFYTEILGLKVINEMYRADRDSYKLDMEVGNHLQLELFSFPKSPKRASYPEACGLRHLSFSVNNLDSVISYLKDNDVKCEEVRVDQVTGKKFTFFADPDNLPLEIYEE
jgi:glyoxylase I family protein